MKLSDEFGIGSNWHLNLPDRHIYVYLSDSYVIEKGHFQFCHALLTFQLDMIFFLSPDLAALSTAQACLPSKVVYMSSSFWQLAVESHVLSEAAK